MQEIIKDVQTNGPMAVSFSHPQTCNFLDPSQKSFQQCYLHDMALCLSAFCERVMPENHGENH
jgi:hypothetical protein